MPKNLLNLKNVLIPAQAQTQTGLGVGLNIGLGPGIGPWPVSMRIILGFGVIFKTFLGNCRFFV